MSAPDVIITRVVSILSASDRPSIGAAISAEAPPDNRMTSASPECTAWRDGHRAVAGGFAARIGIGMAGFDPLDARRKIGVGVGADRDRRANRELRDAR